MFIPNSLPAIASVVAVLLLETVCRCLLRAPVVAHHRCGRDDADRASEPVPEVLPPWPTPNFMPLVESMVFGREESDLVRAAASAKRTCRLTCKGGRFQAGDDVGTLAHIGLHQALGLGGILGACTVPVSRVDEPMVETAIRASGMAAQHLVHAVDVAGHAQIGRPDHLARGIAGIDRGFARAASEHVELVVRFHLHVGHLVVGRTHPSSRGQRDELAAPDGDHQIAVGRLMVAVA
jgi:hypothetical protein